MTDEDKIYDGALDPPRVALVSGFWGQNIGNAYFNIGGRYLLEQVFGEGNVEFIQDQPGYKTFHNKSTGNPENDLELLRFLDVDYIVLQGPMLTPQFRDLWEPTFKALTANGTRIIFLSAALFKHTEEEIQANRGFLEEYPPAIFSTRDHSSYEAFKDLCDHSYSGIDSAFFIKDAYNPFELTIGPYVTLNFDYYPEPKFTVEPKDTLDPEDFDKTFTALDRDWGADFPPVQQRMAKAGKWQAYIGHALDFRSFPTEIAGRTIVRPEHRYQPYVKWKIYKEPNSVASDEPFTYFTLYAGTDLTLSDRVHACVATLAYGNQAMLFHPTPRGELFEQVGITDIRDRPVSVDLDHLQKYKDGQISFVKDAVAALE